MNAFVTIIYRIYQRRNQTLKRRWSPLARTVEYVYNGRCYSYLAQHWSCKSFFLIQGTGVGLRQNFGGGLARILLVEFSGIASMEAVLNFAGVVEIEFAGAVELESYILYHVNNVCSGLLLR
ncbi:hypothetical protein Bca4012_094114 [Brassica carinata]|uniref:Uncharacterized protein n=1 Tax=Brassica carinata TaxID=52824 RepID=A0A8X7TXA6_BRACI|nr:hypothetical protein Bca52824_076230 [Brassica carinata]